MASGSWVQCGAERRLGRTGGHRLTVPRVGDDDTVVEKGGVKVILDSQSAPLLSGAEVDYVESVQGSGFAIKNPQAKTTCGCGSSFSS